MHSENTIIPKSFYSTGKNENNLNSHAINLGIKKQKKAKCITKIKNKIINLREEDEEKSVSLYNQITDSSQKNNESSSSFEKVDDESEESNLEKNKHISYFKKQPAKILISKEIEKKYNSDIFNQKNRIKRNIIKENHFNVISNIKSNQLNINQIKR